tara:strand:+ start:207 stop:863 length:657 start_codon:yes stop_codon:yes gene_type:complete
MVKKLYIEFIGMPASGKSYYLKKIKKNLKKEKVKSNNFEELNKLAKVFFLILFFIKYPIYSIKVLYVFFNLDFKKRETRRHFYYFLNEAPLRIYNQLNNKIIINSEGFMYRSVFYINSLRSLFNKKKIKTFINNLPKTHLLIFVKSSKNLNIKRSKKREYGYLYTKQDLKLYSINEKIIKQICQESKEKSVVLQISKKSEKKDLKKISNIINKMSQIN